MANYPHLIRRGNTIYHYVRVPADIVATYGKRFDRKSLQTASVREAASKLAAEDERVYRKFDVHRTKGAVATSEAIPDRPVGLDIATLSKRHAHAVVQAEFAFRAERFAKLHRHVAEYGSPRGLYRGEIIPLPESDYLDHILGDPETEPETAVAVIHRVRLKDRIKTLRKALQTGNFGIMTKVLEREAAGVDSGQALVAARALIKAEIEALQDLLEDVASVDQLVPPRSCKRCIIGRQWPKQGRTEH